MKNIKLIIILFLLFGFASVYSQQSQATKSDAVTKANNNALVDPKLSPEEQAEILIAGQDNPAKIDESQIVDSKIDPAELPTDEDFGESNANPPDVEDEKLKTPINQPTKTKEVVQKQNSQPKGKTAENVMNYRNMNGPKDQPKGKEAGSVTNYREMKGSKSQPLPATTKDPKKLN